MVKPIKYHDTSKSIGPVMINSGGKNNVMMEQIIMMPNSNTIFLMLMIIPRIMSFANCAKENGNFFCVNISSVASDNKENKGDRQMRVKYFENVLVINQNTSFNVQDKKTAK